MHVDRLYPLTVKLIGIMIVIMLMIRYKTNDCFTD